MPRDVNWKTDQKIHFDKNDLPLPDSPICDDLKMLSLQVPSLIIIPQNFFTHMTKLKVLDLSNTNIVTLPTSISSLHKLEELDLSNTNIVSLPTSIGTLHSLKKFFLRDCCSLIELPPEIGKLSNLKLFDIKGTELMFIPTEMGKLKQLEFLRVSLSQHAKYYIKNIAVKDTVIPIHMISDLKQLKELCVIISVGLEPEWWKEEVTYLQNELCDLENLETLRWYLPSKEVLQKFLSLKRKNGVLIYANVSNLMLTIGHHAQLTSCLPHGLEKKFQEVKNCLKWINAEGEVDDISKIMERTEALFLSRHWTIKNLPTPNIRLKYCLLAECNEMETLVEVDGSSKDLETRIENGEKFGLELLQYLSIHHMMKLQSIWKGSIGKHSLSKLRILALHTCSQLTSIFSPAIAQNLSSLVELTVEDCPKVTSLISGESYNVKYIFPSLERMFLLDLPELDKIFRCEVILEKLCTLLVYACLKLRYLNIEELPNVKKIEGEDEWWKNLECDKSARKINFEPLKRGRDLVERLFKATNSLQHFHDDLLHDQLYSNYRIPRSKLGWGVPHLHKGIVAFDEPLKKLKTKVLYGIDDDFGEGSIDIDYDTNKDSVVVVTAAGGFGKTTLATLLCYDSEIIAEFGENIFFVKVTETPNFMEIVNDLLNLNYFGLPLLFQSDEDAKNTLRNFLHKKVSRPMLLVLDDVWDDSFIHNFPLNIKGCKILVTSRTTFSKYDVFRFDPLSDEDANILFCQSTFTIDKKISRPMVDEELLNQMVKHCKKHPFTLRLVGNSLNVTDEQPLRSMLHTLSQGISLLDLYKELRNSLKISFKSLDEETKECYMDFGLFPEDQSIPASALQDMWVHLYNHDHEGYDTSNKIVRLSSKNLVDLVASRERKNSGAIVNYCDQQFVRQHGLLRDLAIHLSSKPKVPIADRKRLILNAQGIDPPESNFEIHEPMQARILSISSGELYPWSWHNMNVPKVEVMVLNFKSDHYILPRFMNEMQRLKVLNVTNYGLLPTDIMNFHLLGSLSNLSRIRLEHVIIFSLSTSVLALENLQKASFIRCLTRSGFIPEFSSDNLKVWPSLIELEMDHCQSLMRFPGLLCNSVHLKILSITNCNEMFEISDEVGNLTNLENLCLRSCTKLRKLPSSITRLQKLSVLDISDCLSLRELPANMGNLGGLREIYMKGCTSIYELPSSIKELSDTVVLCDKQLYHQWGEFKNVVARSGRRWNRNLVKLG